MAQSLTRQDVEDIALLARLELGDPETEALAVELSAILEYMEVLRAVDTEGVDPMTHAVPMTLRLRDDEACESLPASVALSGAPDREDGYFRVPNVIKPGSQSGE